MRSPITIYLIASEAAFSIYRGEGTRGLTRIAHQKADQLGQVVHGFRSEKVHGHTGPGGASFTVGADPGAGEDLERASLARHAVAALDQAWTAARADRIVIAAGPKLLGALRDALPKQLAAHVAAELPKDLMKTPEAELPRHLAGVSGV